MAFQYQYQYQYQYQLQRGLGISTYDSFTQLIRDTYSNPIIISLTVAVLPLLLLAFWKRFTRTFVYAKLMAAYRQRQTQKQRKLAVEEFNATFLMKEKKDISTAVFMLVLLALGGLILTKSLMFIAVTSNSMAPGFWETDLVLVESISNQYQTGDIAVFKDPRVPEVNVIHRVASINLDGQMKTRGDNNPTVDDWTLQNEDILGKALTFNGKPIVAKKVGKYFIRGYDQNLETDPTFKTLRRSTDSIRANGPLLLTIIFLLIFLTQIQQSEKSKFY